MTETRRRGQASTGSKRGGTAEQTSTVRISYDDAVRTARCASVLDCACVLWCTTVAVPVCATSSTKRGFVQSFLSIRSSPPETMLRGPDKRGSIEDMGALCMMWIQIRVEANTFL